MSLSLVDFATYASVTSPDLSDDEQALVTHLDNIRSIRDADMRLYDAYYNGNQLIRDLGIAIPPQVRGLSTVVGWPQIAVDALEERLDVEGFRFSGASGGDDELWGIWQANNLDEESQLAHLDALVYGQAFVSVGSNPDGSPLVTVESAKDMSVVWDGRWRTITSALRVYGGDEFGRNLQATLYLPAQTVFLASGDSGWVVTNRDVHNLGVVPVARLANRQRVWDRDGRSEITRQVMAVTDAACRTLLGMEVAREFFAAPMRAVIGADESLFQDAAGNPKSPWETYIGRMLGLSADEFGNTPDIKQLPGADPSAFSKVMDVLRQEMAALTRLPPYMLGETTQNPASADAIRSAENGLVRRAERRQRAFSGGWETAMRLALQVAHGGVLPDGAMSMETLWAPAATPTPAATTDSVTKQVAAGIIAPTSDVTREELGYGPLQRARLAEDDKTNVTEELVMAVAQALEAKGLRTFKAVEADAGAPVTAQPTAPPAQ